MFSFDTPESTERVVTLGNTSSQKWNGARPRSIPAPFQSLDQECTTYMHWLLLLRLEKRSQQHLCF